MSDPINEKTDIQPENITVSEAGRILELYSGGPDIDFGIDGETIGSITKSDLKRIKSMIGDFARAKQSIEDEGGRNKWKNNVPAEVSNERKQDVTAIVELLIDTLETYFSKAAEYREKVPFSLDISMAEFPTVIDFMHFCSHSVGFPANWVASDDLKIFFDTAEEQKERKLNKIEFLARVITHMGEDFLNQNAEERAAKIEAIVAKAQAEMTEEYTDVKKLLDGIDDMIAMLEKAEECMRSELDILNKLSDPLCVAIPRNMDDVQKIAALAAECSTELKVNEHWLTDSWGRERDKVVEKALDVVRRASLAKATVLEEYDKAILDIDYAGIMARMDNEYATPFLRVIAPQFKNDMNAIRVHRKQSTKKITYEEMFDILEKIKKYRDIVSQAEAFRDEFTACLGGWYDGEHIDFDGARAAFARFDHIKAFYRGSIPSGIKAEILSGRNVGKYTEEAGELSALVADPSVEGFRQMVANSNRALPDNIETAERLKQLLEALKKELMDLLREFYSKETLYNCYDSIISLSRLQAIESLDQSDEPHLKEMYGDLFRGGATDWKTIISKLGWANDYVARRKKVKTNDAFDRGVASAGEFSQETEHVAVFLEAFMRNETPKIAAFDKLFSGNEDPDKKRLSAKLEKARSYRESLKKFDVKEAFSNAIDVFFDMGFEDYVNKVLQSQIRPEEYEAAFMKRFAKLRLEQLAASAEPAEAEAPEDAVVTEETFEAVTPEAEAPVATEEAVAAEEEAVIEEAEPLDFGVFTELVYEKAAKGKTSPGELVEKLTDALAKIAKTQSPVHMDIVCRQLAPLFGYVKVTPKIKDDVTAVIEAKAEGMYSLKGEYLWASDQSVVIPKLPEEGAKARPLDKIAPEELSAAMAVIRRRNPEIKKDALIKELAKAYGCTKLTAALKKYISEIM